MPSEPELNHLRQTCIRLAGQGVDLARRMQRTDIPRHRKADKSLVTEADTAVERMLIEAIRREFPDDAIIGEESAGGAGAGDRGPNPAAAERFWILDPIDGTRSYARGAPWYCCSVAVADRDRPIAGAVVEAGTGMIVSAAAGLGAYRDDRPVAVGDVPLGKDTFIGVPSRHAVPLPTAVGSWCNRCVIRNYGTAALHLALVAAGLLDAALIMEPKIWDIAAGGLAVIEAGGLLTDFAGRPLFPLDIPAQADSPQPFRTLAAAPACHGQLLQELH